jgi:serine phosphatase RsbU (regulator of sigma subunit)
MWCKVFTQIIVVVLGASMVFAQSPEKLHMEDGEKLYSLTGKWKFSRIDRSIYASLDYKDTDWENIDVPGQWHILGMKNIKTAWYRRHVSIDSEFAKTPVSIRVPTIADAHEFYFNGVKVGSVGEISPDGTIKKKSCVPGVYAIPDDIINYDNDNVIAIRVSDNVGWGGFITTSFLIGSSKTLRTQFQRDIMWNAAIAFVLVFLGMYHLVLFLLRLKDGIYFYFSILSTVAGITLFGSTGLVYLIIDNFWVNHFVFHSGLNILAVFAFLFIYSYFDYEPDLIFKVTIAIFTILFSILLLTPLHLSILKFYGNYTLTAAIVMDMGAIIWIMHLVYKSIRMKKMGAKIVGIGSALCIVALANDLLGYLNILQTQRLVAEGFTLFIISISVDMALKYAKLYDALQAAQKELIAKKIIDHELKLAAEVQRSLLPKTIPQAPSFSIDAYLKPARQVGGDFYDVIEIDEENFGILIGDVADKGIHAAMFMAVTRTLFHCEIYNSLSPAKVTKAVHRHIMESVSSKDVFVTAFYGVLHSPTGQLTYVRAGHELPLLFRPGKPVDKIESVGRFLGMIDEFDVEEYTFKLETGDKIVLYSDGVPEATNISGDQFGNTRFMECLNRFGSLPASQLVSQIVETTNTWTQGSAPFDDLTLLVVEAK